MTTRRGILVAALSLTAIAFLGSLGHVYGTVNAHDGDAPVTMTVIVALMPEITVALVLVKLLTQGPRQPIVWFVGATALAFSAGANIAQRADGAWGLIVAAWPAWSSVGAMLLVHTRSRPTKAQLAEEEAARRREAEEDARRATAAREEANRLEAVRLEVERDQLAQRERELTEQAEQRKADERAQRRESHQPRPSAQPPEQGAEDILLPAARKAAERIQSRGETVTRDRLRDQMVADGRLTGRGRNERAGELLWQLRDEQRRAG